MSLFKNKTATQSVTERYPDEKVKTLCNWEHTKMRVGIEVIVGAGFIIGFFDVAHGLVEVGTLVDSLVSFFKPKVVAIHVSVFLA